MSEIDDIFSSSKQKKGPSSTVKESSSKKRPLKSVLDTSADQPGRKKDSIPKSSSKKRPLPETVVDTSTDLPGPSKRRKKDSNSKLTKSRKSTDFGDSRGSGDRKSNHLTFWS